ncbi:MAG TPA: pyridoxal-phosphate dependent enzyme [Opitutaceae bacterium]
MSSNSPLVTLADVRAAHARIRACVHRTPVLTCGRLDEATGARLFFKCENFQKVGAFKARGAHNLILGLGDTEAARGVVTHSSGNHAAAVALAARRRGVPATIVMPRNAPRVKQAAVAGYGATIVPCEPTLAAREAAAAEIIARTGATLVHPYDDDRIIAGQGTAALELLEDAPDLELLLTPVGGGGLLSGSAVTAKALRPGLRVIGTEPAAADDAAQSFRAGRRLAGPPPQTIADGLRVSLGERNFAHIIRHVDDIVTVSEAGIVLAMRLVWESMKIIIEPSSAVPVAALLENRLPAGGRRVGVILTGGNVDLDALPWSGR